jgi:hypothetical protein
MAKRLNEAILAREASAVLAELGRELCRNCRGWINLDAADHRPNDDPHRRVCRTCGAEYGTTKASPYPPREKYSPLRRDVAPKKNAA